MARSKSDKPSEKPTFESSLARLEEIVRKLEDEPVSLEESLGLFAEGKRLARDCTRELERVENRVRQLVENPSGETVEAPFDDPGGAPSEPSPE